MEFYGPAFESKPEPDETGSVEDSKKKKKKTTRIPKSAGFLPKLEADEIKSPEKDKESKPENILEEIFAKEADKEKYDDEQASESSSESVMPAAEAVKEDEEVIPQESYETHEEEPQDEEQSLEGEFADEGTIIGRAEAPKAQAKPEALDDALSHEEPVLGPVESPGEGFEPPKPPADTTSSYEALEPDEPFSAAETESEEYSNTEAYDEPLEFNQGSAQEADFMAQRARTESVEPTIPVSEHENEVYRARKQANSRGVLTGGVFGYWLGRRGRRAAEQEAEAAYEELGKQNKKIERLEAEQAMATERFRAIHKTEAELINHTQTNEQVVVNQNAENGPVSTSQKEAASPKFEKQANKETAPEDQPITEETYKAPSGRRVETSAWHRYEVDEKTGKVIENPELAYGQEFASEQRQERLQRPAAEPHVAVQLGAAVVQNTSASDVVNPLSATEPTKEIQATPGKGLSWNTIKQKPAFKQLVRRTTNPVTWIIALGLVVLLFLTGIL